MTNEKRYLVYTEVREQYGAGRKLLDTLVSSRRLHRVKVGTAWRYNRAELEHIFSGGLIRRHIRKGRTATA